MAEGTEVDEPATARGLAAMPTGALARFYAWGLLSEFSLTAGIWILFLQSRGFSLAEIGLAESVFHLAPLSLELLTGSLADLFGRKWSLALSSLCLALSAIVMLQATTLWLVLPAMYLNGAFYAFRSGAQEALLFDTLAERGAAARFTGLLGKLYSATYLVIAVTTWLGGWMADRGFAWPYLLTAGFGLAGFALALTLREPERARSRHRNPARIVAEAIGIVRAHPDLPLLLIYAAALWTLSALIGLYAQAVLSEMGLPPSGVGLVIGSTLFFTAVGAWFAGRLATRGAFQRWTLLVTLGAVAAALGLGSERLPLAVAAYVIGELLFGAYEPMLSGRINAGIGSTERATILSVQGFLFSATMIWAFPLFGAAATRFGWLPAYAGA
ncbi:MAG TPA: MFS transporter, partial [Thermomicrobiales bacterium]|nr:MFS transporter [Thermomicrobiales bacterium]